MPESRLATTTRRFLRVSVATLLCALCLPSATLAQDDAPLDYLALGDSLAWGIGAQQGYVPQYRDALAEATGTTINLRNAAVPGADSSDLRQALLSNESLRALVRDAEIITFNIGGNDLLDAHAAYRDGDCGGTENQECLRETEAKIGTNWDAILTELRVLTSDRTPLVRTMDIYNPFVSADLANGTFAAFAPYIARINAHIVESSVAAGIPVALVSRAFNGPDGMTDPRDAGLLWIDGIHPSSAGHALIADTLINLAFAPLVPSANAIFDSIWSLADSPIQLGAVSRTWIWGPQPIVQLTAEPYAQSPGTLRSVRYYDKSRMEINHPEADPTADWFVTNGLLVVEMVTGRIQIGDSAWVQGQPADINIAGDPDDPHGPTYATFAQLLALAPLPDGTTIVQRVDRAGSVTDDPSLASFGATTAIRVTVPGIDHQVASPFWTFMNSSGLVWIDGALTEAPLFPGPFYATGLPISEAYWTSVRVAGTPQDVLVQCFERRCLTWTPGNPPEWQVEAGNVGLHYYLWRYTTNPSAIDLSAR